MPPRRRAPRPPAAPPAPSPTRLDLGAPEAEVRPRGAWLWRRCCARCQGGSGSRLPVHLPVAPAVPWDLPARPRPGCRNASRSPGMGLPGVFGLDLGPGGDRKVQPSPGKPGRARFRRQNCLHTLIRDFMLPPPPPPLLCGTELTGIVSPRARFSLGSHPGLLGEAPTVLRCVR